MEISISQAQKLHASGNLAAAEAMYRQLEATSFCNPRILLALGQICYQRGNYDDSITFLKRLCSTHTTNANYHFSLAGVCRASGRTEEATAYYQHAIQLQPDFTDAYICLGDIYSGQHLYTQSLESYERALSTRPEDIKALYNSALALTRIGRVERAVERMEMVLSLDPGLHNVHSGKLFILHYLESMDAGQLYNAHREWAIRHADHLPGTELPGNPPDLSRTIRVGYVSPDLYRHSVAYFMCPVLEGHHGSAVESFCYSDSHKNDDMTHRLRTYAHSWRDIADWSDEQLIMQIRNDNIDILVDLAGHSASNRLLVFARKPAPVQVTYLGYPDITGLKCMDYRLTDGWADPAGIPDHPHGEKLIRVPSGFLCYETVDDAPGISEPPAAKNGMITFGSFNNLPKINKTVIHTWSEILKALPDSGLLLKSRGLGDETGRKLIHEGFAAHGIDPCRIECVGHVPDRTEHLALYNRIDIALDTFPYNGTTTTCEALWMGVPVITLTGNIHCARVGTSILSVTGLQDCIKRTQSEYIACAIDKAGDLQQLGHLRQTLRAKMQASPLMDRMRFARELEQLYREFLCKCCDTRPTDS